MLGPGWALRICINLPEVKARRLEIRTNVPTTLLFYSSIAPAAAPEMPFSVYIFAILTSSKNQAHVAYHKEKDEDKDARYEAAWNSLSFRSIGPAFTSGRIADFAVNPKNPSEFYVATAAGGVWNTVIKGLYF